jgi:hypothetical protein
MLSLWYDAFMNKRSYVAIPTKLTAQFETVAEALGMNVNQFGVHCLEGCMAAIQGDNPTEVPIVRHARRILRKDATAADRLLLDLLMKTFPDLPTNTERFRELLIEETNKIAGELTNERLKQAHSVAMSRWKLEDKMMRDYANGEIPRKIGRAS